MLETEIKEAEDAHKREGKWMNAKNDKINFYFKKVQEKKRGGSPPPKGFSDPAPDQDEADLESEL